MAAATTRDFELCSFGLLTLTAKVIRQPAILNTTEEYHVSMIPLTGFRG